MKQYRLKDFKLGYYIGNFLPSIIRTKQFEVAYKVHKKGSYWPRHIQKHAIEVNLVTKGRLSLNGLIFKRGDLILVPSNFPIKPRFLTNVEVVVVKVPSLPHDKIVLDK